DVKGSYLQTTEYYVEPRTGAIINQVVHQERVARGVGKILDLDLAFTDDQIRTNVDDAHANIGQLRLIEDIVPLVGYLAGGLAVVAGLALLLLGRRGRRAGQDETEQVAEAATPSVPRSS
ncbi:porin PorA family protein, partial [Nocardioides sp.]|uniref:porin PorA family protein n=1 Tax=Nocardioides sp. TaxID=35761 RepID=UPI0025FC9D08